MSSFTLTAKAVDDLADIGAFTISRWGEAQCDAYLEQLDDCFHKLAERPELGRTCDGIREGYRKYHQGRHVVFYRGVDDGSIEIVRVLHEHMDFAAHLD